MTGSVPVTWWPPPRTGPSSRRNREDENRPAVHVVISAFDVPFGLTAPTGQDLEILVRHLPASWKRQSPGRAPVPAIQFSATWSRAKGVDRVVVDGRRLIAARRTPDVLARLPSTLEAEVVARASFTVLHAGVVGSEGCALIVPGRSFRGKSRLVRALVEAGCTYYSDDLALVDSAGHVHAVGNPLAIRHSGGARSTVPAKLLGWSANLPSLPIGLVYFGRYRPRATFDPSPLSAGESTMSLLAHTISSVPDQFRVLAHIGSRALSIRADRGEATTTARCLMALLQSRDSRS